MQHVLSSRVMNKLLGLCWMLLLSATAATNASVAIAQKAAIVKFSELEKMMSMQNDTTYVFNFFATWCGPCAQELPFFQSFSAHYADKKTRVIFVSLDFKKDFRKHLIPFVKSHNVTNTVLLLDETDYNSWIDKVDSSWNGDLPATLIVNNSSHKREILHRELSYSELEAAVKPFLP